jgi:hypothetical protein
MDNICTRCGGQAFGDTLCINCRLRPVMERIFGREPRYRYFSYGQWRFCWTTEKMGDGKYAAFIYKPIGKGSQSGKATRWKLVKELHFTKRSTAKARAIKWANAHQKRVAA